MEHETLDVSGLRATVLLNPRAGTLARMEGDPAERVRAAFAAAGMAADVRPVDPPGLQAAIDDLLRAPEQGPIVVGGGDGTINTAAAALTGTGRVLGILPLGTFNHFAKELGIPLDIEAAARVIAAGSVLERDVADVNGRVFINHSAVGLYPEVLRHRELQQARGRSKQMGMLFACIRVLRRFPRFGLRLRVGGDVQTRRTGFVFLSNNRYIIEGYGLRDLAPAEEGRLLLVATRDKTRAGFVWLGLKSLLSRLGPGDVDAVAFTEATIESRRPRLRVNLDGELAMLAPPLDYRVRPGALRVLASPTGGTT